MKIDYNIPDNRVEISEFDGIVGDEAFSADEIAWLQFQLWALSQTTIPEHRSATAAKLEIVLAALINDTDAVILHRIKE